MATEIAGLIERLEKATGPSAELGVRILSALLSTRPITVVEQSMFNGEWCAYYEGLDGRVRLWEAPEPFRRMGNVTASLDAALALVERVRPDGWPGLQKNRHGERPSDWSAWIDLLAPGEHECVEAAASTPAIALLIALLRTLEPHNG